MAKQAPATPIWAADASGLDPKRSHRFILNLEDVPAYFVKSSGVPSIAISSTAKHQFLGHTFKFPGTLTWGPESLDITLVDTIDYNMAQKFSQYIRTAGYVYPSQFSENSSDPQYFRKTISKAKFPFRRMSLDRIDAEGNRYEQWVLNNCFITKVSFGDADYGKEELLNVVVGVTFDWAELRDKNGAILPFPGANT